MGDAGGDGETDDSASHEGASDAETTADAYDVVVVGGGAAGLSAAVFLARYGLATLVLDRGPSAIRRSYLLENYLGFPGGIDPETFLSLGREHVRYEGGTVVDDMAVAVERRDEAAEEGPPVGPGFRVRTQEGRAVSADFVLAASAYDGDYLADLGGAGHDADEHPVASDDDGRSEVPGLYVAGWLSGGPHQAVTCAGHGATVAKTLLTDLRRAEGFWSGPDQYWDWCVETGTYGDDEWERHVDEWLDGTLSDGETEETVADERVERVRERVKRERLDFERSPEERRRRRQDARDLLREHLFDGNDRDDERPAGEEPRTNDDSPAPDTADEE